jgi:hypothetical protein
MLTVREGDRLAGYLILHMIGDDATIDDLLAESDSACTALLVEATVVARRRGVHTLSAPWLSSHPGRQLLERCGFQPRETRPVVLLAPPAEASGTTAKHQWYFTSGDCEG